MRASLLGLSASPDAALAAGRNKPPATAGKETRVAVRFPASAVPSITGVRLSIDGDAEADSEDCTLVDISTHGVGVECGRRYLPKTDVTVLFDGSFAPSSVASRVARCTVAGIADDGSLRYQVGIAFAHAIEIAEASPSVTVHASRRPEPGVAPAPVVRYRW